MEGHGRGHTPTTDSGVAGCRSKDALRKDPVPHPSTKSILTARLTTFARHHQSIRNDQAALVTSIGKIDGFENASKFDMLKGAQMFLQLSMTMQHKKMTFTSPLQSIPHGTSRN